jgi:hypothetical protein
MKNNFKKWIIAALIRAIRTFAQTLITLIGSDYINIIDINWVKILGIAGTTALVSILMSITGLPEVKE